ncbi:hypothetical protein [Duganella sp. LjRoot269]|uniref:hypothetical protein n=1 Tax=Duganella sp. LjRoot269 TaxID=3342305 RepID=UPI003ED0F4A8
MMKAAITKLKDFFLHSKSFDHATRRVGALLLLLPCLVGIPLGVHRPFLGLGWGDWYLLPSLFVISCCGTILYVHSGEKGWALLTALYTLGIAHELWLIATVPLSSTQQGEEK